MDALSRAVLEAAHDGAPPKTWRVGEDADVEFGTGDNPFEGMVVTDWTVD